MANKLTTEDFIIKAKEVHGDKYDYSLSNYAKVNIKTIIICPEHGEFTTTPEKHLNRKQGCPKCANKNVTTEVFIEKAKKIHGDRYDYSLVNYTTAKAKIKIKCTLDNFIFEQTPNSHLNGSGCPKCSGKNITTNEFITKAKETHGIKYDYSLTEYKNNTTDIKIICPVHGVFEQNPYNHLKGAGCSKCTGNKKQTKIDFITKSSQIHGDKYNYELVVYTNIHTKVKIICPQHGVFEQSPHSHSKGVGCPKCNGGIKLTKEHFIEKAKKIHGDKYDYSLVRYIKNSLKVKIKCQIHDFIFEQTPSNHLNGNGCPKCSGSYMNTEYFKEKSNKTHNYKYDYSKVIYVNSGHKITIICKKHGEFYQTPFSHMSGCGCPICNLGFTKQFKLNLLNTLSESDLLEMDPIELLTIIKQGNLPSEFLKLIDSDSNTLERVTTLNQLKELFNNDIQNENSDEDNNNNSSVDINANIQDNEIVQIDAVDNEVINGKSTKNGESALPNLRTLVDSLHSLDKSLYASMDEEAFELLIQCKLRKLWNDVLNNKVNILDIQNGSGGKYFTIIKNLFLDEYNGICNYTPPVGYNFKYQPNLMQKLTVNRLIKNKSYGNWSGTGAGKTLSFIISSREINAKLTLVIALNSTIEQTCESIKEVYPNSVTYTEYEKDYVFDTSKHNYLVLNYEKFQQGYSEELYQSLTNNNQIDFIVIDEVHNAKQRDDENESIRRGVLSRLIGRSRQNNDNLHILVMSATPVINNLFEAKSLLQLMTGLEYEELNDRRTLTNALEIFKQLTLNGLRFIPNYDIKENELTGSNLTNLNIDGSHLLNDLLTIPSNRYFEIEKLLLPDKLNSIKQYLKKGVVIYTYFTDGIVNDVKKFVEECGFSVGIYTGDIDSDYRTTTLKKFIDGKIDILIGSKPVGTGVDGLQKVCDRAIMITLPWTDSEYQQFKGRIYRQGSVFDSIEIIIPQVRIELEDGQFWYWDVQRLNIIKTKRTLADACVDGLITSKVLPKPETLFKKAQESLLKWKDRVDNGNIIKNN